MTETLTPQRTEIEVIRELTEALAWTGGSADFAPGGIAREGWKKVVEPALQAGNVALAAARTKEEA